MDRASIMKAILSSPEPVDSNQFSLKEEDQITSPGIRVRKSLAFTKKGICLIHLEGLPKPFEIEALIEDYVTNVELLPYPLKVIVLDISELVHLQAQSRKLFSELLVQASKRYGDQVQLVIAGGPPMIRKYTEIFCRALKFSKHTISFETTEQAKDWLKETQ